MLRILFAIVCCLAAGCSSRPALRAHGDPDGVPITFGVAYARDVLDTLIPSGPGFTRTVVVEPAFSPWHDPYPFHHHHGGWQGEGFLSTPMAYEPSTTLFLLAGDGPAQAQVFRLRLAEPSTSFSVAIRPGRRVIVTLQASGGREGWQEIGEFTAAPDQLVRVTLDANGPRLETTPAPAPDPKPASAAPSASGP